MSFLFIGISSCTKEDLGLTAEMKGTIDGASWEATIRATTLQTDKFIITGTASDGKTIVLTVNGTNEGLYKLSPIEALLECGAVYKESVNLNDEDAYISLSGEMNITKIDENKKRISGDYSFIMKKLDDEIVISGSFSDLYYTGN